MKSGLAERRAPQAAESNDARHAGRHASMFSSSFPLVGPNSASGSEVLAGALRDHGRAQLVGDQTFGKGSVNHLRELSNGGALYVTIARWLTPNGDLIEGVGLTPDVQVDTTPEELQSGSGPQFFAAINLLEQQLAAAAQ